MAGFSKKVKQESGNGGAGAISGEAWDAWNSYSQWDILDVTPQTLPNGSELKEMQVIGVLNFISELGSQPQDDASMKSTLTLPEEGEDYSQEEIDEMKKYPSNYFKWVDEYKDGKKLNVRKKFWPKNPEEELIFAVDFPELMVDYGKHPANDTENVEMKPLRIDYNDHDFKDRTKLGRHITNEVNYKTGKFSDKDIKYKITSACGNLEEYQNDQHDLSHLVQATCYWTVKMTKKVTDKGTYYNTKIVDPAPIQDIKARGKVVATVAEQLEDAKCDVPFCGILMNEGEYPEENLRQMRKMWIDLAQQATTFDRNVDSNREGEWICGVGYEGSDLQKALEKFTTVTDKPKSVVPSKPAEKEPEPVPTYNEPPINFDDDIPF